MNTYELVLHLKDAKITALISDNFCSADLNPDATVHTHSFTEIFGVVEVPFIIKTVDANFCIDSRTLLVIPYNLYHFVSGLKQNYRLQLKVEKRLFKDKSDFYKKISALLSTHEIKRFNLTDSIENIFKEIDKELQTKAPDTDYISSLLSAFVYKFANAFENTQEFVFNTNNNYVFKINGILERRYKETLYISDIAKELNLSTRQVLRIIKSNYNKTFTSLLSEKRLAVAAYLLKNTTLSIEEIAPLVGFNCTSSLYNNFKSLYGVSPNKYRKSCNI